MSCRWPLWLALIGALGVACSPRGCAGEARRGTSTAVKAPLVCVDCNLVIIALTAVRKDHLGLFGYRRPTSPQIDRFFAEAFLFDRAFAPTSWTLPVAASMFTSRYPYSHGVMDRYDGSRLGNEVETLAVVLSRAGYRTAAVTGGGDYNRRYGLAQGFGDYVDEANYDVFGIRPTADTGRRLELAYLGLEELIPVASEWLEVNNKERFFLFLQGYDAHCPFSPKPPFDEMFDPSYSGTVDTSRCIYTTGRVQPHQEGGTRTWPVWVSAPGFPQTELSDRDVEHMVALYDGEVAQVDNALDPLFATFDRLHLTERTVIVLLAEHGDLFGEHGRFMRGGPLHGTFYDPVVNFPLAIRHPGQRAGQRLDALVETTDLLPTFLDLLGLDDPDRNRRQGQSFMTVLRDPTQAIHQRAFGGARYAACRTTLFSGMSVAEYVREPDWKLIHEEEWSTTTHQRTASTDLLFDLGADPGEERDESANRPEVAERLRGLLEAKFPERREHEEAATCAAKEPNQRE